MQANNVTRRSITITATPGMIVAKNVVDERSSVATAPKSGGVVTGVMIEL